MNVLIIEPFNYSLYILILPVHFNFSSFTREGGCISIMADALMRFVKKTQKLNMSRIKTRKWVIAPFSGLFLLCDCIKI